MIKRKQKRSVSGSYLNRNFAVVIPMANEAADFTPFIQAIQQVLDYIGRGTCYLVIDKVSHDKTLMLARRLSAKDKRFVTIWAPKNRHSVDAYLRGYQIAYERGHDPIIEMDAGLSHDPRALPMFLRVLSEGNECAFGSRFINGGSIQQSNFRRHLFSRGGTFLSNLLLGTQMHDMTSGYQGFHASVVQQFLQYPFRSTAHFYQTELRYLLRQKRYAEVPIHYRAPSPSVSSKSVMNSFVVLGYYFWRRVSGQSLILP